MPTEEFREGLKANIAVYVTEEGDCPAREFIDRLSAQEQKAVVQILNRFATFGIIHDEKRFRNEEDGVYVFKYKQVRLCCFFQPDVHPKTIILTHGFIKKSKKMDPSEKKRALRIREKVLREKIK